MDDVEIQAQIAKKVHPEFKVRINRINKDRQYCVVDGDYKFDILETDANGVPTQQAKERALDTMISFHLTAYRYTNGLYGARHCMGSTDQMDAPTVCVAIFEAAKKELKGG